MAVENRTQPHHSAESLFDEVGAGYEAAFEGLPAQAASLEWLKAELTHKPHAKILDIGCGTGRPVCSTLAAAGHSVLGIDVSRVMVSTARQRVPEAEFEQIDFRKFHAAPGTYDAVTIYFSLIAGVTQEEIREAFRRVYDWLKPGGLFVFATVPVAGNNLEITWMGKRIVVSSLSAEESVEAIKDAGFVVVQQSVSTFMPKGAEAEICRSEDVWEETHLFVYAKKG